MSTDFQTVREIFRVEPSERQFARRVTAGNMLAGVALATAMFWDGRPLAGIVSVAYATTEGLVALNNLDSRPNQSTPNSAQR